VALMHLVDTSVLTRLDRSNVRVALEPLTAGGRGARAGIYDADFDVIARVTGQPCDWVVPAGTID